MDRINDMIIEKLMNDNMNLLKENNELTRRVELLEGMLDVLESQMDIMIAEMQAECEMKDRVIENLEQKLLDVDLMKFIECFMDKDEE